MSKKKPNCHTVLPGDRYTLDANEAIIHVVAIDNVDGVIYLYVNGELKAVQGSIGKGD